MKSFKAGSENCALIGTELEKQSLLVSDKWHPLDGSSFYAVDTKLHYIYYGNQWYL